MVCITEVFVIFKRLTLSSTAFLMLISLAVPALPVKASSVNLMVNPSAEIANGILPANWSADKWGTNTASITYIDGGHSGLKSLSVNMTSRTDGDAKWAPDAVSISGGQSYTYNDFYQSNVATELDVAYTDANGGVTYAYLGSVASSATWNQSNVVFTAPANAVKASVLHIIASVGTLQTDDFSLTQTAPTQPPPVDTSGNLIANGSFETVNGTGPSNWQTGKWGTNNASFTYLNSGHTGNKSANVLITSYSSGDAKWEADPANVTAGKIYTYSDYYQANVATAVVAKYITSTGITSYVDMPAPAASTGWIQYSANLTIPTGVTKVTILHLLNKVGSLTIDDASLFPATDPVPPVINQNQIANSSVETVNPSNTKLPTGWTTSKWGTNSTTFTYLTSGAHTGSRAVQAKISRYTNGDAKWYFDPIAVIPDTQYAFSDYYTATVSTEVVAAFDMADGSTQYDIIGLPDSATSWAKFSTTFVPPLGAKTMTVYHLIQKVGTLTIDDADLHSYKPTGLNRALVSLTFDDGYNTEFSNGLPLLQKYGFNSTQFIATGLLNTPGYMTSAQVKQLYQAGQEIGSHTVSHSDLTSLTASQYDNELAQSKNTLQQLIGAPVTDFAFPEGVYNSAVTTVTKKYYSSSRGVENGLNSKDNFNAYDIKVQDIFSSTSTEQVADWVKQAQATNTWLVLVYHSIDPNPTSIYSSTPAQLDAQLGAIKASGIVVKTMNQALAEITPQL